MQNLQSAMGIVALIAFAWAISENRRAISLRPDYAEAHSNRGNVLKDLGRLDEAMASYDRAIRLKPDYAEAHSSRGNALARFGHLDEALVVVAVMELQAGHARTVAGVGSGRPLSRGCDAGTAGT